MDEAAVAEAVPHTVAGSPEEPTQTEVSTEQGAGPDSIRPEANAELVIQNLRQELESARQLHATSQQAQKDQLKALSSTLKGTIRELEQERQQKETIHAEAQKIGTALDESNKDTQRLRAQTESLGQELEKVVADLAASKKELAARIKHYESKLMTVSVINGALQSENDKLKEQVQASIGSTGRAEKELNELQEEFTKRLGVAEKTAFVMKEECFGLRAQVEEMKKAAERTNSQLLEKQTLIDQYKGEGDVLAKKNGELEKDLKRLRADAARQEQEKEKLVARVHVLEAAAKSEESSRLGSVEEANKKIAALRQSMAEQKSNFTELLAQAQKAKDAELLALREAAAEQASRSARELHEREEMLSASLDNMRQALAQAQQDASEREDKLRDEIWRMKEAIRESERAQEDAGGLLNQATWPLLRQIEGLTAQAARTEALLQEREEQLRQQQAEWEGAVGMAQEQQRRAEASCAAAERRAAALEEAAAEARSAAAKALSSRKADEEERQHLRAHLESALEEAAAAEEQKREAAATLASARAAQEAAEKALHIVRLELKAELEEERQRSAAQSILLAKLEKEAQESASSPRIRGSPRSAHRAIDGLLPDQLTLGDSPSPRRAGLPASRLLEKGLDSPISRVPGGGASAVAMERHLAKIRQLQGELAQVQRELASCKAAHEHANEELLEATQKLQSLHQGGHEALALKAELEDLKKRHEMALVIIGERNEKAEELEADMADVKALYREQINLLVNQIDPEKWPKGYRICLFCSHCAQVERGKKRAT